MSATPAERTAIFREVLNLSGMFRQNVALKHGLPMPSTNDLTAADQSAAVTQPNTPGTAAQTMEQPSSGVHPAQASAWPSWVKPALVAGAIALSGGGLGGIVTYLLTGRAAPQQPAEPQGNLLQWLQDNGQNVPPSWEGNP